MLLFSQGRDRILNYDNIPMLDLVDKTYSCEGCQIQASFLEGGKREKRIIIGVYSHKMRAMEVLREICSFYESLNYYEPDGDNKYDGFVKNGVFKMPLE